MLFFFPLDSLPWRCKESEQGSQNTVLNTYLCIFTAVSKLQEFSWYQKSIQKRFLSSEIQFSDLIWWSSHVSLLLNLSKYFWIIRKSQKINLTSEILYCIVSNNCWSNSLALLISYANNRGLLYIFSVRWNSFSTVFHCFLSSYLLFSVSEFTLPCGWHKVSFTSLIALFILSRMLLSKQTETKL